MTKLAGLLIEAAEHLDPGRQGIHWPDPIAWDGRPLDEQARDIMALLDARAADGDERALALSGRIASALNPA